VQGDGDFRRPPLRLYPFVIGQIRSFMTSLHDASIPVEPHMVD
jgi:hypothetical protein